MNSIGRKISLTLFVALGITCQVKGQSTVFSVLKNPLKLANENFAEGNYAESIRLYQNVLSRNPSDLGTQLKLAQSYYKTKNYQKSVSLYNSYLSHNNDLPLTDIFLYAEAQAAVKNSAVALNYYRKYLERQPNDDVVAKKIWRINNMNYLFEDSARYAIRRLSINTNYGELCPISYRDGLVFTSNRKVVKAVDRVNAKLNEPFYQLYQASLKTDSSGTGYVMANPKPFVQALNSPYNTGPVAFFLNGREMVYVASAAGADANGGRALGLYFAKFEDGKWKLGLSYPYNSDDYSISDVTITEDGTRLFFTSDMKGGQGGRDIYTSQWKDEKWSKPKNLGEVVNTPQNEMFPYIHPDGSLYFSSDGLPGLGQLDIFKTEIQMDVYGEPQNVGYPINSSYDDFGLSFDSLATHGYFTSNRKNGGFDDDIYEFDMDLQKYPVMIAGIIKSKEYTWSQESANKPWPNVKIFVVDSRNGKSVYEGSTDASGNFSITIPYFSKYFLRIIDSSGTEHKAILEIAKYRSEISNHEIVVVKDIFNQKEEKKQYD